MKKNIINSDEALEKFLDVEQKSITKRVKWAEKRSRIETTIWAILFIGALVWACLGWSDISFGFSMMSLLVLAILTSEQGFLSGYAAGRYDMSITNLRLALKKGNKDERQDK